MSDFIPDPGSDKEWESLLDQLRLQPKPAPRPFFYARVRTRLVARANAPTMLLPSWLRRPLYAAVLGALVLIVSGDGAGATTAANIRASSPAQLVPH